MKQKPNEGTCQRLTANWDEPVVRAVSHGSRTPDRKVVTNGRTEILLPAQIASRLVAELRQGREVVFAARGKGGICRFYPLASTDMSRIFVAAQCIKPFSADTLADKWPKAIKLKAGTNQHRVQVEKVLGTQEERDEFVKEHKRVVEVTPSMMVECPKCGFEFRVEKRSEA